MTLDQELLDILVCPETKQPVSLADAELLDRLNARVRDGTLENRAAQTVAEPLDAALVREDRVVCYAIRDDIPIMLIEEAIPLDQLDGADGQRS